MEGSPLVGKISLFFPPYLLKTYNFVDPRLLARSCQVDKWTIPFRCWLRVCDGAEWCLDTTKIRKVGPGMQALRMNRNTCHKIWCIWHLLAMIDKVFLTNTGILTTLQCEKNPGCLFCVGEMMLSQKDPVKKPTNTPPWWFPSSESPFPAHFQPKHVFNFLDCVLWIIIRCI